MQSSRTENDFKFVSLYVLNDNIFDRTRKK